MKKINSWHSLDMKYKKFKQSIKITNLYGKTEKFIYKLEDINMKYRKKQVVVDAIEYTGSLVNVVDLKENFLGIKMHFENDAEILTTHILTLSGVLEVKKGDWIIKGSDAKGGFQFWPVTPEYFAENYEKAEGI